MSSSEVSPSLAEILAGYIDASAGMIATDAARCRATLLDLGTVERRTVNVLTTVVQSGASREMLRAVQAGRPVVRVERYVGVLQRDYGLDGDDAKWAVSVWM